MNFLKYCFFPAFVFSLLSNFNPFVQKLLSVKRNKSLQLFAQGFFFISVYQLTSLTMYEADKSTRAMCGLWNTCHGVNKFWQKMCVGSGMPVMVEINLTEAVYGRWNICHVGNKFDRGCVWALKYLSWWKLIW